MTRWMLDNDVDVTDHALVATLRRPARDRRPAATRRTRQSRSTASTWPLRSGRRRSPPPSPTWRPCPRCAPACSALQRSLIGDGGIVVEGRDIGSVVWPGAEVKVYLTADPSARAVRRTAENGAGSVDATEADLIRRDLIDSGRATAPLTVPAGAVHIDTTPYTLQEVVDRVVALVRDTVGGTRERDRAARSARGPAPHHRRPRAAHLGAPRAGWHLPGDHPPLVRRADPPAGSTSLRPGRWSSRQTTSAVIDGPLMAIWHRARCTRSPSGRCSRARWARSCASPARSRLARVARRPVGGAHRATGAARRRLASASSRREHAAPVSCRPPRAGRRTSPSSPGRRCCRWSTSGRASLAAPRTRSRREGTRVVMQYGEPVHLDQQPWPRRQADVRRSAEQIRLALKDLLDAAERRTGMTTPGPLPDPHREEIL